MNPDLPTGVLGKRYSLDDVAEEYQAGLSEDGSKKTHRSVDVEQFRNYEVGQGFQHPSVIRQSKPQIKGLVIKDMTGGHFGAKIGSAVVLKNAKPKAAPSEGDKEEERLKKKLKKEQKKEKKKEQKKEKKKEQKKEKKKEQKEKKKKQKSSPESA